jgi:N-[(2S)-2-amino-2-carboxyethyl]-L-glutamate dehydrogenase
MNPPRAAEAHTQRSLLVLGAQDVAGLLAGRERELIDLAAQAYRLHGQGESRLPQSEYLRFPQRERERIIPKAGYLGGAHPAAGIKWIASFPDNVGLGLPRASAVIVLNCLHTGRPTTLLEGAQISSQRTAAAAALAARLLHEGPHYKVVGVVGCGPISAETLRFLRADARPLQALLLHDLLPERAHALAASLRATGFQGEIGLARDAREVLDSAELLVFGTSAVEPSVPTLQGCKPTTTVLHVSLRDFGVEAVLAADNLTDDVEQVLQANTSLHRAAQQVGHHAFLRATLAQVLAGQAAPRLGDRPVIVHPFGLAALDLAFAEQLARSARAQGRGLLLPDFLPQE